MPVATVTGSSSTTPLAFGGTHTLSPNQIFSVLFEATIGEPFQFGLVLNANGSAGSDIPCDAPPCVAMASYSNLLLAEQGFQVPAGVTLSEFTPVPEAASLFLLGAGLAGLAAWRRMRVTRGAQA